MNTSSGDDPGFPVGRGADPRGGVTYDFSKKELHDIEKLLVRKGGGNPLDSPLVVTFPLLAFEVI